jgi:hypothetical protein
MDEDLTREMVSDLECAISDVATSLKPLAEIALSLSYIVRRLDDVETAVLEVKHAIANGSSVVSYDYKVAEILDDIKDEIHRLVP